MEYYLAIKKGWSPDTCYNMDEIFKRPHIVQFHLYDIFRIGKANYWMPDAGGGWGKGN